MTLMKSMASLSNKKFLIKIKKIIVTAKMNEFPNPSKASISKQTNQHILKAFNKIKKLIKNHGDNGNARTKNTQL
jgi:Ni,Fe-hydrogenase maturation factor